MHLAMAGQFMCVLNKGTSLERSTGWMHNLITDNGLNAIASQSHQMGRYCAVGTGTSTPANGNTAIQSLLAYTGNIGQTSNATASSSPYQIDQTIGFTFDQGAVVGNITELTIGAGASGTNIFSRCLIVDGGGNPTTLTCTSIDQLTVYYKLSIQRALTDSTGSVSLAGSSYSYTARLAGATNSTITILYGGAAISVGSGGAFVNCYPSTSSIGLVTGSPSDSPTGPVYAAFSQAAYTPGSFQRDATMTLTPSNGNASGGIGAMLIDLGCQIYFQYGFTPAIPKNNTKTLALTFRSSWARA